MRTLLAAAAVLLAVGAAAPSYAAPLHSAAPANTTLVQWVPAAATADGGVVYKKKKKKKSSTSESASIESIGNAKRGKSDLEIKVKVAKADRTCELKIVWHNDDKTEDDADSDEDKICEFSIQVPDDKNVVGDATAEVTVKNADGKKVASTKRTFTVK